MEIVETASLLTGGRIIVDNFDLAIYNVVCNKAQAFFPRSPPFSTIYKRIIRLYGMAFCLIQRGIIGPVNLPDNETAGLKTTMLRVFGTSY